MNINSVNNSQNFGAAPFWPVIEMCKNIKKHDSKLAAKLLNSWDKTLANDSVSFYQRRPRMVEKRIVSQNYPVMEDIFVNMKKVASIPNVDLNEGKAYLRLKRILTKLKLIENGKGTAKNTLRASAK